MGTIRDEVAEHDIKWPGLAAKSLWRWGGRWSFPSLTRSCCFTEKSPPEFTCSLPVTAVLLECSSSPRLDTVKNINFHSISRSGSAPSDQRQPLGLMQETQQWLSGGGLGQNWRLQGALNKNHTKWKAEGERGGKERIGVWLRLQSLALKPSAAWPGCFACFRRVFREPITLTTGWKAKQLIMCKGSLQIIPCVTTVLKITKTYFYSNCKRRRSKVRKLHVCIQTILCTKRDRRLLGRKAT